MDRSASIRKPFVSNQVTPLPTTPGIALAKQGQTDEAIGEFQQALRLKPDSANAHNNLGNALLNKGRTDEAVGELKQALRPQTRLPQRLTTTRLRSLATNRAGLTKPPAIPEALRLKPDYAEAQENLALRASQRGNLDGAIGQFQEAIRLKPDYAGAQNNWRKPWN